MQIERIRKHWIWAFIFSVLTLIGFYWQFKSARHEMGGILNATFHSRTLGNKDSRTIVVCVDDTTQHIRDLYLTPTFDNQDEYTLRDFSLIYEITSKDVKILPSGFVSAYNEDNNTVLFRYDQNVLNAHMDTKNPFAGFVMHSDFARCEIVSKVSFDGAASLFEYRTDVWFIYKPNDKNLSFDYWKQNCKQRVFEIVDDKAFDIYYISKNENPEYQFDVILSHNTKNTQKVSTKDNPTKEYVSNNSNKNHTNDSKNNIVESTQNNNKTVPELSDNQKVSVAKITTEEENEYADLSIDDYNVERGDSTTITLFFDHPANISGDYILSFYVEDGWLIKTVFKHLYIERGQKGYTFTESGEIHKIAKPTLFHQVNPDEHIEIERNYNGYFSAIPLKGRPMLRLNYDGQGYFFRQMDANGYSFHFKKDVNIEVFDENRSLMSIFLFLVDYFFYIFGVSLVGVLIAGVIKNTNVSMGFFVISIGLSLIYVAIMLGLTLCIFFHLVGCYIKLMI